jgi:hypothetical protein
MSARLNVAPNLIFGLCLIVVGGTLALDRMHLLEASRVLQFWPIGLVIFGLSLVAQTFRRDQAGAAAGDGPSTFHGGHVLGIVLIGILVTQALRGREAPRVAPSGTVSLFGVMSEDRRVSGASPFRGADMTSVMGNCTLDLRQAVLAPGEETTIDVFTLMGGAVVRVPDGWTVDVRAVPIMGGVRDQRAGAGGRVAGTRRLRDGDVEVNDPAAAAPSVSVEQTTPAPGPAPRVVLRGYVMMGGLIIRS